MERGPRPKTATVERREASVPRHGTRRASPARKSRLANATTEQVRLPALRPPLQGDGRDHKGTTRAQKRASGTRTVVLFGIVNSRCAPLRGSRHNVSNRRRLPAAVWPRACRMPCRATRIVGAGGYPSTPAHCIFPVVYNAARWTAPFACCCKAYGASHSLRWVPDLVEFTLGPREARTRGLAQARSLHSSGTRGRLCINAPASCIFPVIYRCGEQQSACLPPPCPSNRSRMFPTSAINAWPTSGRPEVGCKRRRGRWSRWRVGNAS
jgi:hypothetical protein